MGVLSVLVDPDLDAAASAVESLYARERTGLVRLAVFLIADSGRAEEIVQDAFIDLYRNWPRIRDKGSAAAYVRRAVVSRTRSELRHRRVMGRYLQTIDREATSAESSTIQMLERESLVTALQGLPRRQREVLVLRYYADLSEAEIAAALGVSRGSIKSHASRGLRALRQLLEVTSDGATH